MTPGSTVAPALAPEQIERQVTYPLETALAGIPGLTSTRSLSRNGFAQITAVFDDSTDIYFARAQVGERPDSGLGADDLDRGGRSLLHENLSGATVFECEKYQINRIIERHHEARHRWIRDRD